MGIAPAWRMRGSERELLGRLVANCAKWVKGRSPFQGRTNKNSSYFSRIVWQTRRQSTPPALSPLIAKTSISNVSTISPQLVGQPSVVITKPIESRNWLRKV